MEIPKDEIENLNISNMGRGGIVSVKRARVVSNSNIKYELSTSIGLER